MIIKAFSEKIILHEKRDALKLHLYLKFIQNDIQVFDNDMNIVIELYLFGGYKNAEEQKKFFDICLEKNYRKSKQSIRNALSKYTNLGVLERNRNTSLSVSKNFIPNVAFDKLVLQHIITHAK